MKVDQLGLVGLEGVPGVAMTMLSPGKSAELVRVDVALLDAGASLPKHPGGREQVFYVLSGHGRVAGDDDIELQVRAGSMVLWEAGEHHTSWADSPMTVVIVQRCPAA